MSNVDKMGGAGAASKPQKMVKKGQASSGGIQGEISKANRFGGKNDKAEISKEAKQANAKKG